MARIYRLTDRIPVKIDGITVTISPLSFDQKIELQSLMLQAKADPMFAVKGARLAIKYAVKGIEGLEDSSGQPYIVLVENGQLSDECVDDLLNLQENSKIITLCSQLINGVPRVVIDPSTGKQMDGISFETTAPKGKARK